MPLWEVGETEDEDEDDEFDFVAQLKEGLQDPQVQARLYQEAQANDVPPELLKAFIPGQSVEPGDVLEMVEERQQNEPASSGPDPDRPGKSPEEREIATESNGELPDTDETTTMPTQTDTTDFSADDLLDIIDQIIEIHGEEMTLAEFREWANSNRDLIENFADQMV